MANDKSGLTVILGMGKGKPKAEAEDGWAKEPESETESESGDDMAQAAADEVLAAIAAKDATALKDALAAFVSCCSGSED